MEEWKRNQRPAHGLPLSFREKKLSERESPWMHCVHSDEYAVSWSRVFRVWGTVIYSIAEKIMCVCVRTITHTANSCNWLQQTLHKCAGYQNFGSSLSWNLDMAHGLNHCSLIYDTRNLTETILWNADVNTLVWGTRWFSLTLSGAWVEMQMGTAQH